MQKRRIARIDEKISLVRSEKGFLHSVLTKDGDELVKNVILLLDAIGVDDVVNADELPERKQIKEEDLWINESGTPLILAEVKGLSGLPTEADSIQIVKYIPRRMKDLNRLDVRGLFIVNHQRQLAPLDRDHQNVFTPQQIKDAENHEYALITTWDLYRLYKGMQKWGWPSSVVRPLLEMNGRVQPTALHYERIGVVGKVWSQAESIRVTLGNDKVLEVGQRIGLSFEIDYFEQDLSSLQVNDKPVTKSGPGENVGVKLNSIPKDLKAGLPVYRVGVVT